MLPRRASAKSVFPGTGLPRRASGLCRCGALRVALAVVANLHSCILRIDTVANRQGASCECFKCLLANASRVLCDSANGHRAHDECGGSCECILRVLRMYSMNNLHAARRSPPPCCRSNARRTLPSPTRRRAEAGIRRGRGSLASGLALIGD